jgi:hypothetical protein
VIPFEREPKRDGSRDPRRDERGRAFHPARDPLGARSLGAGDPLSSSAGSSGTGGARARGAHWSSYAGWLTGPLILCATVAAMLFVTRGPDHLFAVAFGLVLALGSAWILTSALFPARAERNCPECGRAAVVRIDAHSRIGLRCRNCARRDESASAFIQAEDGGVPFEDAVVRDRRRNRRF